MDTIFVRMIDIYEKIIRYIYILSIKIYIFISYSNSDEKAKNGQNQSYFFLENNIYS